MKSKFLSSLATSALLASALTVTAATFTWDGGGADANSATIANWNPDAAPTSNGDIIFGAAGVSGTTINWTSGNIFSLTFSPGASAYTMTSSAGFQFNQANAGTIVNNSSVTQAFTSDVRVFFNNAKNFAANTGNLSFANVQFRGDSLASGQTNTLQLSGASNGTISGALSQTGIVAGASTALTKTGTGTWTLTGTSTFTGLITVNNGTLSLSRSTVGLTGGNALTFTGTSTFNMDNAGATAAQSMTLGALSFSAGEGSVRTTRTAAQNEKITFASLATRAAGATGNFVNTGTNGATNGFVFLAAPAATQIIDRGVFYNGSSYAAYDSGGFVRSLAYGTDTNSNASLTGAQTTLGTIASTTNAQYTGLANAATTSGAVQAALGTSLEVTDGTKFLVGQAITGTNIPANAWITAISGNTLTLSIPTTTLVAAGTTLTPYNSVAAQTSGTLNTLNLSGAGASLTLAASQTLALGGILRSGNNTGIAGVISGGTALTAATAGGELVVRTDTANDTLVINSVIANNTSASSLTKSGAGLLNLTGVSTYTGATRVNAGTLRFNRTTAGALATTSAITVAPGATLQLQGVNSVTSTLAAPLTLSGNGSAASYSLEFPGGNSQTYTMSGGVTIVGGAVIRSFGLANAYNFLTAAIAGNATASGLTFRSEGANTVNQQHIYNINVAATYTGNTTLLAQSQGGIIKLGVANALPTTTSLNLIGGTSVNTAAALDLNGKTQTLAGITATSNTGGARVINSSATASTLTINNSADLTMAGVLGGTGTNHNNFGLIKSNAGTFALSGVNTYTGATQVNAGTLVIGTSGSLANTAVTVGGSTATGTPTLAGGGAIGGATVIAAATEFGVAGTHSPGVAGVANGVGTQTFSSTLNYDTGSIFEWDLKASDTADIGVVADTATGTYDKVVAAEAITGGAAIFKVVLSGNTFADAFWDTDKSWTNIFSGVGAPTNLAAVFSSFSATGGLDSSGSVTGRGQFTFNGSSSTLNWSAVPEPTSALAGLLLGVGLLRRRRA